MNFAEFLNTNAPYIDKEIEKILKNYALQIGNVSKNLKEKFKLFEKSSKGGKRIRGALVLLGFKAAGGKSLKKVLNAAAAFEIFQTSILAQDDIIDKSKKRRGIPALHTALGGNHKAVSETICLSDLGFFIAYKLISEIQVKENLKIHSVNLFSEALIDTVIGEMLDIELAGKSFSEKDVLNLGYLKTAKYSFASPLQIGAILAGANSLFISKLRIFGDNLGIAYQLQDDILGVFGQEKDTRKDIDSDIKEGKATLVFLKALEKSRGSDLQILKKFYGKTNIKNSDIDKIREVFIKSGARDYCENKINYYLKIAVKTLSGIDQSLLSSLVEFLNIRKN